MVLSEQAKKKKAEYTENYKKEKYKQVIIRIKKDDKKIIEYLDSLNSRNEYINELIKDDLKKKGIIE